MKIRFLPLQFYFGLFIFLIGILFKIQHYPGGMLCLRTGIIILAVFWVLLLTEMISSQKAGIITKAAWVAAYILIPMVATSFWGLLLLALLILALGITYLYAGRKLFLPKKTMAEQFPFDSIK